MGISKDKKTRVKRMDNKKTRNVIIVTYTKKDMSTMREYEKENVREKKKNCNSTRCILQQMTELDLHLKLEKCWFATTEVEYLRMIVKSGQPTMDPIKLDGIASWPIPQKVKDIRSFLSFANFY